MSHTQFNAECSIVVAALYAARGYNKSNNGLLRAVLGGWQINGVFQTQSGQLITPQSGIDSNRNRDAAGDRTIVNLNGIPGTGSGAYGVNAAGQRIVDESGSDLLGDASTVAYVAINPSAQYIQAGFGARANAGRNTLRTNSFGIGAVSFAFPDVTSPLFNNYSPGNFSGRTVQLRAKFIF